MTVAPHIHHGLGVARRWWHATKRSLVQMVAVSGRVAWRTAVVQLVVELDQQVPALVVQTVVGEDGVDHGGWPQIGDGGADRWTEAEEAGQRATWDLEGLFGREDVLVARVVAACSHCVTELRSTPTALARARWLIRWRRRAAASA